MLALIAAYGLAKRYTVVKKKTVTEREKYISSLEAALEDSRNEVQLQDLDKPLTRTPTYAEVGKAVDRLLQKMNQFGPDCIFGIDRGGAIVGGILAKHRGSDTLVNILAVRSKLNPPDDVIPHLIDCPPSPKRILIVDDRYYTGDNMKAAINYLEKTYPGAAVQAIVLVGPEHPDTGAGKNLKPPPGNLFCASRGEHNRVRLPWDP